MRIETRLPVFALTSRRSFTNCVVCSGVACDMLIRATFMPAMTNSSRVSGSSVAGPRVAIIFVLRFAVMVQYVTVRMLPYGTEAIKQN